MFAFAFAAKRAGIITKDDRDEMEMIVREHRHLEEEERAKRGDTRSHREIIQAITARILAQGKAV